MNALDTLNRARAAGVEVVIADGQIKARGPTEALAAWAPALRPYREELLALLAAPEPRPDWRVLARAYDAHHFNCPACIAAGKLRDGSRCPVGKVLWQAYCAASAPASNNITKDTQ